MKRFHRLVGCSMVAITLALDVESASAQVVVFDPNNYAQNVLTAARALQQINNQIVSLQNQAQMLINQAKNLATLPFSALLQLEQSILRTQPTTSGRSTAHSRRPTRRRHPAFQIRR
jgi:type IV secretion system protein TrbJ